MTSLFAAVLSVLIAPSNACEVKSFKVKFKPGLGTHIAYFCEATENEKKQALEMMRQHACIPQKLKEFKKPVIAEEAVDIRPYWFSKQDAQRSGPILDLRLVLIEDKQGDVVKKQIGLRALATGRKVAILPPPIPGNTAPQQPIIFAIDYELGEPSLYEHDCPLSGCVDTYVDACPKP